MDYSIFNIFFFILTTVLYYVVLKPKLTHEIMSDKDQFTAYQKKNLQSLGIYFLVTTLVQFLINVASISSTCGGKITQNMGIAGMITFMNWSLIFGVIIVVLIMYPGMKSAFSDVIGYFVVSRSATNLLTELLVDPKIEGKILTATEGDIEKKKALEEVADTIIKICGNNSILINQIIPTNFNDYWQMLTPLMKDQYQNGEDAATLDKKSKLFELVEKRDMIGELMWYIYTGIFMICVVQYKISIQGCTGNTAEMQANYQQFLESEDEASKEKENTQEQVYTITD